MEYYEDYGGAIAKLNWDYTGDQVTTPLYKAEYFDNKSLLGSPTYQLNEDSINNIWNRNAPHSSIPVDQFSARWIKTDYFAKGNYEFDIKADDGVRLYIDNVKVLDKWFDQPSTNYKIQKYLPQGYHEIKLEYYENFGGAIAIMNYKKVGDLANGFKGEYYD